LPSANPFAQPEALELQRIAQRAHSGRGALREEFAALFQDAVLTELSDLTYCSRVWQTCHQTYHY